MPRAVTCALALSVALLPAACTSDGGADGRAAASPEPSRAPLELAWERAGLRPASRPLEARGRLLLYEVREGALHLVALDPRGGSTVWEHPATDSGITGGVSFDVTVDEEHAYYLRETERGFAQLVAVDLDNGTERWATEQGVGWLDMPTFCDGDRTQLCASAFLDGKQSLLQVSATDGRLRKVSGPSATSRGLGKGLRDTGARAPDVIVRTEDDGTEVWRRPAKELFGGRDVSSDGGWYFGRSGPLYVGHLGLRPPKDQDEDGPFPLDDAVMAGFDRATGAPRWVEPGVAYRCHGSLDVYLGEDDEEADEEADEAADDGPHFRCRTTGTISVRGEERPVSDDMRVVVEGFDPQTGRTTWSVDLGRAPGLAGGEPAPAGLPDGRVVLTGDDRRVALDLATGETEDVAQDSTGWCALTNDFDLTDSVEFNNDRVGEDLLVPCRTDGTPLDVPDGLDSRYGLRFDDLLVWADRDGVRAAREAR